MMLRNSPTRLKSFAIAILLMMAINIQAAAQNGGALGAEAQRLVERLILDRANVLAQLQRRSDQRAGSLLISLSERDQSLRVIIAGTNVTQSEITNLNRQLDATTRQRIEATEQLGAYDGSFAADLEAYREAVTSLASSSDPRRVKALSRYAEGDRAGALTILIELQEAETKAVAAGWREIAALALDMRDRGQRSTREVRSIYQTITRLDPSHAEDWRRLAELDREVGDTAGMARSTAAAFTAAGSASERFQIQALLARVDLLKGNAELGGAAASRLVEAFRMTISSPTDADLVALFEATDVHANAVLLTEKHSQTDARLAMFERLIGEYSETIAIGRSYHTETRPEAVVRAFARLFEGRATLYGSNDDRNGQPHDAEAALADANEALRLAGVAVKQSKQAVFGPSQRMLAALYGHRGMVYAVMDQRDRAARDFREAVSLLDRALVSDPDSVLLRIERASSASMLGVMTNDIKIAREALKQLEALDANGLLPAFDLVHLLNARTMVKHMF